MALSLIFKRSIHSIHSQAIEDKHVTFSAGRKICAEYGEKVAQLSSSELLTAAHKALKKAGIPAVWTTAPYNSCAVFDISGKKGTIMRGPCDRNLPVLCTNTAAKTTREGLAYGIPASIEVSPPAGPIRGGRDNYSWRFLGVPYASPPIGSRRLALPVLAPKFSKPFSALKYGPHCASFTSYSNVDPANMSEDCLLMNIYTPKVGKPAKGDRPLPVMFWIHGGGLVGGGIDDLSDQYGNFVSRNQVVMVMLQYRLGLYFHTQYS